MPYLCRAMFTINQIQQITGAQWLQQANADAPIQHLLTDSRKIAFAPDAVFFALSGATYNGNSFVGEAYAKGVRNFVVSRSLNAVAYPDANFLLVPNALTALQQVAAAHRRRFTLPVVGITGSNGKTVVKEWLYQLLWQNYHIVRSPKSYNSQVGVPLSVWKIEPAHNLALFEAGISQPAEMDKLEPVIQPQIGIFTNIGNAHNEGFENMQQKATEKMHLFKHAQYLIYCADYPLISKAIQTCRTQYPHLYRFTALAWSKQAPAPHLALYAHPQRHSHHTTLTITYKNLPAFSFQLPFIDEASIENAIHCCLFMLHLELPVPVIIERMAQLSPVEMRLEQRKGINQCTIINDSYNSDFNSLAIALDFLERQTQHPTKTVILSDMLETGEPPQTLYARVAQLLQQKQVHRFIGIGQGLASVKELFAPLNAVFFHSTAHFLSHNMAFSNEAILVKGARPFAFEKIVRALAQKVHNTTLEINLNAITHNLKVYRSLLLPTTKIMIMVKSLSYGSGGFEIAALLQQNKADYLAVAYTDEGVELRQAGITLPIMVMNPNPGSFNALVRNRLEPEMYSLPHLQRFVEYLHHSPVDVVFPYPIHLKLDTGMHRLGFELPDIPQLIGILKNNPYLHIASVFTHLAAGDDARHDDFTHSQIALFEQMYSQLLPCFATPPLRHLLNSSGISRFADAAQMDMVRLGLGLYGIDPTGSVQHLLANVSALKTHVSQVKTVQPSQTVGYSRMGKVTRPTRIATVGIGYADGLNRRLSNGRGKMWIKGCLAPIIGNICMDMCMLDVTDIPDVQEGDEAIVFGEQLPVQQLARWQETIPYEIFTGISGRVKRVYFQE